MKFFRKIYFILFILFLCSHGCFAKTKSTDFATQFLSYIEQNKNLTALQLPGITNLEVPDRIYELLDLIVVDSSKFVFDEEEIHFEAMSKIGWTEVPVLISFAPSQDQDVDIVLSFSLPDGWKLSNFLPDLGKLDMFVFKNMKLFVSNYQYQDESLGITVKKGANLFGNLSLSGPLYYASLLLGNVFEHISISGLIKPDVAGSSFTAQLPGSLSFMGGINASDLGFSILVGEESKDSLCEIGARLLVGWKGQDSIEFKTKIGFGPSLVSLYGSMDGTIKNLIGIYGVNAGNWFIGGTVDNNSLTAMLGLIPLTDFTIGFDLDIVGKKVEMVGKVGVPGLTDLGDLAFEGKLDGDLTLSDCVCFVGDVIEETPYISENVQDFEQKVEGVIPNFVLGDVHFFFSPKDVTMGGVEYTKGLIIDGVAQLFGSDAQIFIDMQGSGMKIIGYLEALQFGPLKITGAGYDRIMDTPDDGLILDAELGLENQYCYMSGQVEVDILGGISSDVVINVNKNNFSFNLEQKLFDLFDFGLLFSSKMNTQNVPFDFYVKGYMYQNALTDLQAILSKTARKMAKKKMLKIQQSKLSLCDMVSGAYNRFWNLLASFVGNTFNIQEFSFESSLDQLVGQTKLPSVAIKGVILGKAFELHDIAFDVSDPISSAKEVIEKISELFD
ncbi:hypothetical protein KAH94_03710 [bacterium]|nr:hypothetical protein [bacterium]